MKTFHIRKVKYNEQIENVIVYLMYLGGKKKKKKKIIRQIYKICFIKKKKIFSKFKTFAREVQIALQITAGYPSKHFPLHCLKEVWG